MSSSLCLVANEPTLVYAALHQQIVAALDGRDPSFALQDFTAKDAGSLSTEPMIGALREALETPPFLVDRRVVVLRDAQNLTTDEADVVVRWIANPAPDIILLIGLVGTPTHKIAKGAGELVTLSVGTGRDEKPTYVRTTLANYGVHLDAGALNELISRVGDEIERVDAIARTLASIYGTTKLNVADIEPYIGDAWSVPEWDLTDAIDKGDVTTAIVIARRMLDSRGRVGLQIINLLQRHFMRAVRLDGLSLSDADAAKLLGSKSAFVGKKAIGNARRLGTDRLGDAMAMLAQADLDLKGAVSFGGKDLENDQDVTELTVIEVLVARLARLSVVRR